MYLVLSTQVQMMDTYTITYVCRSFLQCACRSRTGSLDVPKTPPAQTAASFRRSTRSSRSTFPGTQPVSAMSSPSTSSSLRQEMHTGLGKFPFCVWLPRRRVAALQVERLCVPATPTQSLSVWRSLLHVLRSRLLRPFIRSTPRRC